MSSVILPLILSSLPPTFTLTVYDHQQKNPSDHCNTLSYRLVLLFHHNTLPPTVSSTFLKTTTPTILISVKFKGPKTYHLHGPFDNSTKSKITSIMFHVSKPHLCDKNLNDASINK